MMLSFDASVCTDLKESTSKEWLETNGLGGFACSTISGINTRRYHSLLTIATTPPVGRIRILSKVEESLSIEDQFYNLSANIYPNAIYPNGYKYMTRFDLRPFPTWTFEIEGVIIEKSLFMPYGLNAVICRYRVIDNPEIKCTLHLKPLVCFVEYHSLQHSNSLIDTSFEQIGDHVLIKPYPDLPEIFFSHNADQVNKTAHWYMNFEYPIEKERGFEYHEDLFQPFELKFELNKDAILIVSTDKIPVNKASELATAEIERRRLLADNEKDEFLREIRLASDQFIAKRGDGYTILAGYPWFSDWGRDTMVSLEGLTLCTDRPVIAKNILFEFSKHISQGMLPNCFNEDGTLEYNTADATLWYFQATRAYAQKTGDYDFIKQHLYEKLADIIAWHLRGTRFNIHVDTDGLLFVGEDDSQLTWMDARVEGKAVTPRIGKPVEVQALWFNALKIMSEFADIFGYESEKSLYNSMAEIAAYSFNQLFWNENEECLYDVLANGHVDASIRPNQIFAVSLPFSMLKIDRAKKVVEKVERELLTPFGLRSLSPNDVNYHPKYVGSPSDRDASYHQGTVWTWLIGAFIDAYKKVFPDRKQEIIHLLETFKTHIREACIGQISEIFDGDPPHNPRGCFAQAWSVAEILRSLKNLHSD